MNDLILIRPTGRDDLYSVAVFLRDCWQTAYDSIVAKRDLDAWSVKNRHKGMLARYDEASSECLLMLEAGRLIGVTVFGKSLTEGYEEDGEIVALYLCQDSIGKGYGHRLFVKAEQSLAAKGYAHFVLDVLARNARGLRFYLAHGYEKVADRSIRLGENEYPLVVLRRTG